MPAITDFLPSPPPNLPLPRFLTKKRGSVITQPQVHHGHCEYGLECIKSHFLRAHLFMSEALRFSAGGQITPEAQQKVRLAREQLLCEDDFQATMDAPSEIKGETLKLLASTRSTWKAIEKSGIDMGFGTTDNLKEAADAIQKLYSKAYEIDKQYRLSKGVNSEQ